MTDGALPNPASQGLAADLMRAWEEIITGYSNAFGLQIPFKFKEILIWRVVLAPQGERILAPVQLDDVRPGTPLYMDISLLVDDTEVKTQSTLYVNEEGMPGVTHTEITEFEIVAADVVNHELSAEARERVMEALKAFPFMTVGLLQVRLLAARQGGKGPPPGPPL